MSRKGDCWDNAVAESFFSTLKTERVHHRLYRDRAEARRDIFEYIEVFYNRVRLHSTLGYLSPVSSSLGPWQELHNKYPQNRDTGHYRHGSERSLKS